MSFLSLDEIILFIWGIAALHFIFRWGKKWKGSDSSPKGGTPHEEPGRSIPDAPLPKPAPYASGEDDKEYDYKELRERVLRSWGMKDVRSDEMEKSVYRETAAPTGVSVAESAEGTGNRFQQYLSTSLRKRKTRPVDVEPMEVPAAAQTAADWSEETVRTWVKYDVVFGEPRGRRPWTPFVRH